MAKVPEPSFFLCNVCYQSLDWLKNSTWVGTGTNNLRYVDKKVHTPPPPQVRHVETASRRSHYTSPPPRYFTERLKVDGKDVIFIHQPPVYRNRFHVGISRRYSVYSADNFGEMSEATFDDKTMNGRGDRVLCALCFTEEDLLQIKAKLNITNMPWEVVDPNERAD